MKALFTIILGMACLWANPVAAGTAGEVILLGGIEIREEMIGAIAEGRIAPEESGVECRGLYSLAGVFHCNFFDTGEGRSLWVKSTDSYKGMRIIGFDTELNQVLLAREGQVLSIPMSKTAKLSDFIAAESTHGKTQEASVPAAAALAPRPSPPWNPAASPQAGEQSAAGSMAQGYASGGQASQTTSALLLNRINKGLIPAKVANTARGIPLASGSALEVAEGAGKTFTREVLLELDKDQLEGVLLEYEGVKDGVRTKEQLSGGR